jgi:hypothetical protein
MIDEELTQAFNAKPKLDPTSLRKMTAGQLDSVKVYGSAAENLLKNKDFALFIHHFKFDLADTMTRVMGHTAEENAMRLALVHNVGGSDKFVAYLQNAVMYKNRAVNQQSPADITEKE